MIRVANNIVFEQVEVAIGEGREVRMRIQGYSMYPLMRDGRDNFVLRPMVEGEPVVGDVVLFKYRGRHILHRLLEVRGESYIFRGDGVLEACEQVEAADMIAVVDHVEYVGGRSLSRESSGWRRYNRVWQWLRPMRYLLMKVMRRFW